MLFISVNDLDFLNDQTYVFISIVGTNVFTFVVVAFYEIFNEFLATRRKTVRLRAHNKVI